MSHQQGKEFRFLYLWLEAMLKRVSQQSLGRPAKGGLRDGPACSVAEECPWTQGFPCTWDSPNSEGLCLNTARASHGTVFPIKEI